MIINSSNVGMESAGTYRSATTRKLSFQTKFVSYALEDNVLGNQDLLGENADESLETESEKKNGEAAGKNATEEATENKDAVRNAVDRLKGTSSPILDRIRNISEGTEDRSIERIRERCVLYLWELFFGKDRAKELAEDYNLEAAYGEAQPRQIQMMEISGVEEVSFEETQTMNFSTTGTVKTADGREINFNLDVSMSRSFSQYYKLENRDIVAMCDPLVVNLDDNVVGVSDQKFFFDLDADGTEEEISTLETGNAFLALDHNQDGTINDGSELFGAQSGDGFADLARYDEDGNGWIDEADSVFDKLKIWVKDENGEDVLYTLKQKGLGAIYLGSAATDYTLHSGNTGQVNGAIRKSGVFLYENGMAGTIAHVDLAKGISESA